MSYSINDGRYSFSFWETWEGEHRGLLAYFWRQFCWLKFSLVDESFIVSPVPNSAPDWSKTVGSSSLALSAPIINCSSIKMMSITVKYTWSPSWKWNVQHVYLEMLVFGGFINLFSCLLAIVIFFTGWNALYVTKISFYFITTLGKIAHRSPTKAAKLIVQFIWLKSQW